MAQTVISHQRQSPECCLSRWKVKTSCSDIWTECQSFAETEEDDDDDEGGGNCGLFRRSGVGEADLRPARPLRPHLCSVIYSVCLELICSSSPLRRCETQSCPGPGSQTDGLNASPRSPLHNLYFLSAGWVEGTDRPCPDHCHHVRFIDTYTPSCQLCEPPLSLPASIKRTPPPTPSDFYLAFI